MRKSKGINRRDATRNIGMAAGAAIFGSSIVSAAVPTPAQIEGPFHPGWDQDDLDLDLTLIDGHLDVASGEMMLVRGRVTDTGGNPLRNALVDIWQANEHGKYAHPDDPSPEPLDPNFQGRGVINTDAEGRYAFRTIRPGAYPLKYLGFDGWRAAHIHFQVSHEHSDTLTTQMYFEGDPLLHQDEELAKVPEELHQLLIPKPGIDDGSGLPLLRFDVVLAITDV